ncbi:MAG: copper chaperone PCu(A)C [Alphaproteobacteria bacterium]|nr:copper chaperone PCu(A)C [Alphaproteobacteria bacterium]
MKLKRAFAALLAVLLCMPIAGRLAQALKAGDLIIEQPWSRATPEGARTGAGYLVIRNAGKTDDRLLGASTGGAQRVEVHEMSMDGAIMRMRELPAGVALPAGGTLALKPGGYHLMFIDLKAPLKAGDVLSVTLRFERAGALTVEFAVRATGPAQ